MFYMEFVLYISSAHTLRADIWHSFKPEDVLYLTLFKIPAEYFAWCVWDILKYDNFRTCFGYKFSNKTGSNQ